MKEAWEVFKTRAQTISYKSTSETSPPLNMRASRSHVPISQVGIIREFSDM